MIRRSPRLACGFLIWLAAFAAVYALLCWAPAIYDDQSYIFKNPLVLGSWPGLKAFFLRGAPGYEPLPLLGHWLLHRLVADRVIFYRLTSLLLHGANALLLWRVYRRFLGNDEFSLWAAALFSLFPAHVEALALSTFKTHLAVAFCAFLIIYLQARAGSRLRTAGCWAAMLAAVFCKESALVLPALAWLTVPPGRKNTRPVLLGLVAIAAAYAALRLVWIPLQVQAAPAGAWTGRLLTAAKLSLWYLRQMLWPDGLCLEHSLTPVLSWRDPQALPLLATAGAVLFLTYKIYRWDRVAGIGLAWAAIALCPFLNLIPYFNYSLVADRYMYLASAGFFLCVGRLAARLSQARPGLKSLIALGLGALAACYCSLGLRQAARFCDPLELWSDAARCAPTNPRAHAALGAECSARGHYAQSVAELRLATELDPAYADPYLDLSVAYTRMGRLEDSLAAARQRVALRPDAAGWLNLGASLMEAGLDEEALVPLKRAAAMNPDDPDATLDLGLCWLDLRRWDDALPLLERAARAPRAAARAWAGLGDLWAGKGDIRRSIACYEGALTRDNAQFTVVHKLARQYLALGDTDKAQGLYDAALSRLDKTLATLRANPAAADPQTSAFALKLRAQLSAGRNKIVRSAGR